MAHPLPTDLASSDLHPTPVTDNALELDLLILAAVTFPIFDRTEDAFTEQPIALGPIGTIVNGLRLLNLTVRPRTNSFWRSQPYCDCCEVSAGYSQLSPLQTFDTVNTFTDDIQPPTDMPRTAT